MLKSPERLIKLAVEDVGITNNADNIIGKLSGNNSGSMKEEVMAAFVDRYITASMVVVITYGKGTKNSVENFTNL